MHPYFLALLLLGGHLFLDGEVTAAQAAVPVSQAKFDRSKAGSPMPVAPFTDHAGKIRHLADFRGRPTIVNLWATWCAPCKAEMPALDRYATRNRGRIHVVVVSQDIEGWRAVDKFFRPGRFKALTSYLDQPTELALSYEAAGLPITVAYDAKGRELWRVNGPIEWDETSPPLS